MVVLKCMKVWWKFCTEILTGLILPGSKWNPPPCIQTARGGGHSIFFQVGVCGPDFQSVGLVNWHLPLKRGACERKIPNLGACELKIPNLAACELWVKIEAVEAKISKFSQKGVLWTDSFAWNGTLASGRRGVKRGSSGPHIPIPPFQVSAPPPRDKQEWKTAGL